MQSLPKDSGVGEENWLASIGGSLAKRPASQGFREQDPSTDFQIGAVPIHSQFAISWHTLLATLEKADRPNEKLLE